MATIKKTATKRVTGKGHTLVDTLPASKAKRNTPKNVTAKRATRIRSKMTSGDYIDNVKPKATRVRRGKVDI